MVFWGGPSSWGLRIVEGGKIIMSLERDFIILRVGFMIFFLSFGNEEGQRWNWVLLLNTVD